MTRAGWPDLPPLLAEIADVVGIDAALTIAEVKGGQSARIVSRMSDDHWLVKAIGREKADELSFYMLSGRGRMMIDWPVGPTGSFVAARRQRAKVVAEALAQGATGNEAARRAGITRRSVERHKATRRLAREKDQGSLF